MIESSIELVVVGVVNGSRMEGSMGKVRIDVVCVCDGRFGEKGKRPLASICKSTGTPG